MATQALAEQSAGVRLTLTPIVTVGSYFLWLGWHTPKQVHPDGHLTGPYNAWQVLGFVLTLAVVAVVVTWWSKTAWTAPITMTVATTAYFSAEAATSSDNDGLWPVGAVLVMIGTVLGAGVVSLITATVEKQLR